VNKLIKIGDFVDYDGLVSGKVIRIDGDFVTFEDEMSNYPVTKHKNDLIQY
jgi:hypothetical protein